MAAAVMDVKQLESFVAPHPLSTRYRAIVSYRAEFAPTDTTDTLCAAMARFGVEIPVLTAETSGAIALRVQRTIAAATSSELFAILASHPGDAFAFGSASRTTSLRCQVVEEEKASQGLPPPARATTSSAPSHAAFASGSAAPPSSMMLVRVVGDGTSNVITLPIRRGSSLAMLFPLAAALHPPPPPPAAELAAISTISETRWRELLAREDAMRRSPETQREMAKAESDPDREWMDVAAEIQQWVCSEAEDVVAACGGIERAVRELRRAAQRNPDLALYVRFNRAGRGDVGTVLLFDPREMVHRLSLLPSPTLVAEPAGVTLVTEPAGVTMLGGCGTPSPMFPSVTGSAAVPSPITSSPWRILVAGSLS